MKTSTRCVSALVAAAFASTLPARSALADVVVEHSVHTVRALATSADLIGAGTPVDYTFMLTGPGGDGSTFSSSSPAPHAPWSSTAGYFYSFTEHEDTLGHLLSFSGAGSALAAVSGLPTDPGSGSATAFSDSLIHLSVSSGQMIRITGSVSAHFAPGGGGSSFADLRDSGGAVFWSAASSVGATTFSEIVTLPGGSFRFHARADAFASGAHPGGPFPPGGGDSAFSYDVELIPAPSGALLLGAFVFCARRRRR